MISFNMSKKWLAAIWFIGFLIPFTILALQTLQGTFWNGKESDAWALFTPMILPTIGLIVGVLVADAQNPMVEDRNVSSPIFYMTMALSLLYLGLVITIFVLLPRMAANATDFTAAVTDATGKDAGKASSALLDAFKRSGLILGPIQGLLTTTLGFFFVNKNTKPAAASGSGDGPKGQAGDNKQTDAAKEQAAPDNKQPNEPGNPNH